MPDRPPPPAERPVGAAAADGTATEDRGRSPSEEAGLQPTTPTVPSDTAQPPPVTFRWKVFADATCAGLSVLVPIPLADLVLERFFRRRMPATIAAANGIDVPRERLEGLVPVRPLLSADSCLTLPLAVVLFVLKRISRKLLYFLTIKEATDKLSDHWHRAHLIDHILHRGHLTGDHDPRPTWQALERVLAETDTSPLRQLARKTVRGSHHVLRAVLQARRGTPETAVRRETGVLERNWNEVVGALTALVQQYEMVRQELEHQRADAGAGIAAPQHGDHAPDSGSDPEP